MKRIATVGLLLLATLLSYLLFWPTGVQPVAWHAPVSPGYSGAFAANHRLSGLKQVELKHGIGPEHIAIGPDAMVYTALENGTVLRLSPDGHQQTVFAQTGGRVLGFDFDRQGQLIAADAYRGLLRISSHGQVKLLTDRVSDNDPIRYADAVAVAANGLLYFTEGSHRFSPADWGGTLKASVAEIVEAQGTGRVLVYDPATQHTSVVADHLVFANGITFSADGQKLLVVESGKYRIWLIDPLARDLDIRKPSSHARVLIDNLPGFPDNITRNPQGHFWIGLAKPRSALADGLSELPLVRGMALRLPDALLPVPKPYGHAILVSIDGQVMADLQDPSGAYPEVTGITEGLGRLYVHSLHAHALGLLPDTALTTSAP